MSEKVTIVGVGLVGRAWAISFARAGFEVHITDKCSNAIKVSLAAINCGLKDLAKSELLEGQIVDQVFRRIIPKDNLADALEGASYVQESTVEVLEVKKAVYADLDVLAEPNAVLASSTSGFMPSLFTEFLTGRHRCLVAHPINPPYLIPAVELCPAPWTDSLVMKRAQSILERAGHAPISMAKEVDAFIVNRLQMALLHEAFRLVDQGYATCVDIDRAIKDGLALRWSFMGPFETIDLNAPGGIRDYCIRFGDLIERVGVSQMKNADFRGTLLDTIEDQRCEELSRSELIQRAAWRDRRLMALALHKRHASEKIGD